MNFLPYDASLDLFALLRQIQSRLAIKSEVNPALQSINGLLDVHQYVCVLEDSQREPIIAGLVQSVCPLHAEGLAESVILPTCDQAGLAVEAAMLKDSCKQLRFRMAVILASQPDTKLVDAKRQLRDVFLLAKSSLSTLDEMVLDSFCNHASSYDDAELRALLSGELSAPNILELARIKL